MITFSESLNLAQDPNAPEIRQPQYAHPTSPQPTNTNVATTERWIGGVLGAALILPLLRRSSFATLSLAALGSALLYRSSTGYCPLYNRLGINTARQGHALPEDYFSHGLHVETSYLIRQPSNVLYAFWRDFAHLPTFMTHLQSVKVLSPTRSHWVTAAPLGTVQWDAEIIHDEPNHRISWTSLPGADVDNTGSITFSPLPDNQATDVRVVLDYIPPGGTIGSALANLLRADPYHQIHDDLHRFKALMESGAYEHLPK